MTKTKKIDSAIAEVEYQIERERQNEYLSGERLKTLRLILNILQEIQENENLE